MAQIRQERKHACHGKDRSAAEHVIESAPTSTPVCLGLQDLRVEERPPPYKLQAADSYGSLNKSTCRQ